MENETKAWWTSTTIQGAIISAIGLLVTILKATLGVELLSNAEVDQLVAGLFGLVGLVMIVIGRLKAKPGVKLGWKNSK